MKRWTDEFGLPTVDGAEAMFCAIDEARSRREHRKRVDAENEREHMRLVHADGSSCEDGCGE